MKMKVTMFMVSMLILLNYGYGMGTYNYFQLALQYPPGVCTSKIAFLKGKNCLGIPTNDFSIHGLWPSNYTMPNTLCDGKPRFNPRVVDVTTTRRPLLNVYWRDLFKTNAVGFWGHEWNTHGTCSEGDLNQPQYFDVTLKVGMNLIMALRNARLVGTNTPTTYNAISASVFAATKAYPALRCTINKSTTNAQLSEIVFCLQKVVPLPVTGLLPLENCTANAASTCPPSFEF